MKSKYMLHITVLKNSSWLQHQGFWSFCDLDYGCISCICVQFPIISRNCHKAMYHNRNLKPCSILNTMVSTKYRRWETNQQLAGSTCSTNDQNSIFEIASYNRKKQKKKNHHQNIQCLSMELFHGLPPPWKNTYMVKTKKIRKSLREEKKKKLEDSFGRNYTFCVQEVDSFTWCGPVIRSIKRFIRFWVIFTFFNSNIIPLFVVSYLTHQRKRLASLRKTEFLYVQL